MCRIFGENVENNRLFETCLNIRVFFIFIQIIVCNLNLQTLICRLVQNSNDEKILSRYSGSYEN